jgi:thiamine phosphate synthase YjbQ (UPF0047 family)
MDMYHIKPTLGKWQKLFLTDLKQYGGERVLYLQKKKA